MRNGSSFPTRFQLILNLTAVESSTCPCAALPGFVRAGLDPTLDLIYRLEDYRCL
jgi:hypothetical protein